ncbi:AMP-binding protein [Candidatus Bathyarchaeota archaeon]|nr:AMP-binding protein [Candidatus Bathyarchaeota archaeon]
MYDESTAIDEPEKTKDKLLHELKESSHAPKFNYEATDMLSNAGLELVRKFQAELKELRLDKDLRGEFMCRKLRGLLTTASREIFNYMDLDELKVDVNELTDAEIMDLLHKLPFSKREDLAQRPWKHIPISESFNDMIVYVTAGTTAEPMKVPSHPVTTGCYSPLLLEALHQHGIHPEFSRDDVGICLVCFQEKTVTFVTRLQMVHNSGFMKINIKDSEWRDPLDPYRYIRQFQPRLLTGDPFSFSELAHLGNLLEDAGDDGGRIQPEAMITTAVALKDGIRSYLTDHFDAKVIELYSLTETGPVAYSCRMGHGYHVLPHDIVLEVVDHDGNPVGAGDIGEITISGGRNPYFPLIRYRTGDWGRVDRSGTCECGDPMPLIKDLEGRQPILYHTCNGTWINNRDITAVLEQFPITRFHFHQDGSGNFHLVARLASFDKMTTEELLESALQNILGNTARIDVKIDPKLGDSNRGKVIPFSTEYPLFYE